MREITHIEICSETEIRFLRSGDYQYIIEQIEKFVSELLSYEVLDDQEQDYLKSFGIENFGKEHDLVDILNALDFEDEKVLQKYSERIN